MHAAATFCGGGLRPGGAGPHKTPPAFPLPPSLLSFIIREKPRGGGRGEIRGMHRVEKYIYFLTARARR
jgi:hypothetical protein